MSADTNSSAASAPSGRADTTFLETVNRYLGEPLQEVHDVELCPCRRRHGARCFWSFVGRDAACQVGLRGTCGRACRGKGGKSTFAGGGLAMVFFFHCSVGKERKPWYLAGWRSSQSAHLGVSSLIFVQLEVEVVLAAL